MTDGRPRRLAAVGLALGLLIVATIAGAIAPAHGATRSPTALIEPILPRTSGAGPTIAPVSNATNATWVNVTAEGAGTAPPPGYGESTGYDPIDHLTLLFGGCLNSACPSNETWSFANGTWTNLSPPFGSPPARAYAGMDYDPNMGGLLLFGGIGAANNPLNDTWLFSQGRWTNLTYVGPAPSPRYGAAMAFDPALEENGSVLYGGCVPVPMGSTCTNDTWVWEGWSGWTLLPTSYPPPAVGFAGMTYDPWSQSIVLFGGCFGYLCLSFNNGTWELANGQWGEIGTPVAPPARSGPAMVYDPTDQEILLFGGHDDTQAFDGDTWTFSQNSWAELDSAGGPSARAAASLTLDPTGTTPLLIGGSGADLENDTWAFEVPPVVAATVNGTVGETTEPFSFTLSAANGTAPYDLLLSFGDGTEAWLTGDGPTFTAEHGYVDVGLYRPTVQLVDAVGAQTNTTLGGIQISAGPSITVRASSDVMDVGDSFTFVASAAAGGSSPFAYTWQFGDGTGGSGSNVSHAYTAPGTYTVDVTGVDAVGVAARSSIPVVVNTRPTVGIALLPASPNTTDLVACHALLVGGTGPFEYTWQFGDDAVSTVPAPVHTFARAGTYTVNLWVNDSTGASAHSSTPVTVAGASTPPSTAPSTSSGGGYPTWFWAGLAVLVVIAIAGTAVLLYRGRGGAR